MMPDRHCRHCGRERTMTPVPMNKSGEDVRYFPISYANPMDALS